MNHINTKNIKTFLLFLSLIYFIIIILLNPQVCFNAIFEGFALCYNKVIPAIFPFLIISNIIVNTDLSNYLGLIFYPYIKLLNIHKNISHVGTCLIIGLLGGFAPFTCSLKEKYNHNQINVNNINTLLCCGVSTAPSFVILSVGVIMFNNINAGFILFISITISSLITGILFRCKKSTESLHSNFLSANDNILINSISSAINTMIIICGYVITFNFITESLLININNQYLKIIISILFEVTKGCNECYNLKNGIYYCCIALSFIGISGVFQMKSILPSEVSIKPFIKSRIVHTPLSVLILWLLLKIYPLSNTVFAPQFFSKPNNLILPTDISFIIFLLICICFYDLTPKKLFTKH